mmetsp:Transcript_21581/g.34938  ORF Transcript_21581/g.34938 Transcript_21581/m.34938 type:complete len:203 (+) Transcript_21581:1077-1685(+)
MSGNHLRRRAVDYNLVGRAAVLHVLRELFHVRSRRVLVCPLPLLQVDRQVAISREQHPGVASDGHHTQVHRVFCLELRQLFLHLPEQSLAHEPRPHDAHAEHCFGEVESPVHGVERLGDVLFADHDGDVVFRAALRDGDDVHSGRGKRFEEFCAHAVRLTHVLSYCCKDGAVLNNGHLLDAAGGDGLFKALVESIHRTRRLM